MKRAQDQFPLREDAVRTPDREFDGLSDYPWQPHYLQTLSSLNGLRLHYLDEGEEDGTVTFLCLHGNPAWSYLYRKMIPVWTAAGCRVIAPDLIGFGKSDKPKQVQAHSFTFHRNVLLEFVEHLNLSNVVLVVQDWGGLLGLTLPMDSPQRYKGLLVMNTMLATGEDPLSPGFIAWREMCSKKTNYDIARLFLRSHPVMSAAEAAAFSAPFPDAGHRAALRAFPAMVADTPEAEGADVSRHAQDFWSQHWTGTTLMAIGALDPVLGVDVMRTLQTHIRNCPEPILLPQVGHFVPEEGHAIAHFALSVFVVQ